MSGLEIYFHTRIRSVHCPNGATQIFPTNGVATDLENYLKKKDKTETLHVAYGPECTRCHFKANVNQAQCPVVSTSQGGITSIHLSWAHKTKRYSFNWVSGHRTLSSPCS